MSQISEYLKYLQEERGWTRETVLSALSDAIAAKGLDSIIQSHIDKYVEEEDKIIRDEERLHSHVS